MCLQKSTQSRSTRVKTVVFLGDGPGMLTAKGETKSVNNEDDKNNSFYKCSFVKVVLDHPERMAALLCGTHFTQRKVMFHSQSHVCPCTSAARKAAAGRRPQGHLCGGGGCGCHPPKETLLAASSAVTSLPYLPMETALVRWHSVP